MEQVVNYEFFLRLVRKYWRALVACSVLGVVLAAIVTFGIMTPKYQANVQILVNRRTNSTGNDFAGQQADVQMITTYKELIGNQVILKPAQEMLADAYGVRRSLNDLKQAVSVTSTQNSQVFSIVVTDQSRKHSALIANQVADSFKRQVHKIIKVNNVTIVAPAEAPQLPVAPRKALNLMIGLILGLLLGLSYAALRILTDRRVHDLEFLTGELALPSLGIVNHQPHHSQRKQAANLKRHLHLTNDVQTQLSGKRV
ncbi:YveK family protein [Lactiplantibacillus modestisalitolerans]|uniref:Capsular polysaccharide biosynthesis protein CpsC n=1 Tax=Lactiplantibacillus modestisalitolerans TaxID=1457219 RepID=A0ABV5WUN0_9LACO|nr:Wzz/FepE/Etk N-terminal domain-containing protein [Lactiplantibacillus modestisalitolerans]